MYSEYIRRLDRSNGIIKHFHHIICISDTSEKLPTFKELRQSFLNLVNNGSLALVIDGEMVEPDAEGITGAVSILCSPGDAQTAEGNCGMSRIVCSLCIHIQIHTGIPKTTHSY